MEASAAPTDLVTFADPPVNEVYLSVQFPGPVANDAVLLAEFWPRIRDEYPKLENYPPVARAEERFDQAAFAPPGIPFEFGVGAPPQRYWFVSEDGTRLVQVQSDRFYFNWRRVHVGGDEYPRYRTLRPEFEQAFSALLESLPDDSREAATPDLCEVCYINHIEAAGGDGGHLPLDRVLNFVNEPPAEPLRPMEDMQIRLRSILRNAGEEPVGRMYLTVTPGLRFDDSVPIYVLELLVRGRPASARTDDMVGFFDWGRELIVTTFRDITTQEMHANWGIEGE